MTALSERTIVHCSINQAAGHLTRYFKARGNGEADVARLNLRAEVPVPGSHGSMHLERIAIATVVRRHVAGEMLPHYAVSWAPERPGPYPTFSGDLAIEAGEDYDSFLLALSGTYEPPLGALGAAFDAVVGHRIAELSARSLLAMIADSIEADFRAVEQTKAQTRERERTPHPA